MRPPGRALLLVAVAALAAGALAPRAAATPTTVTVGAFDLVFYNNKDSNGISGYKSVRDWTQQQIDDVVASTAVWTSRIADTPGRQVKVELFWYRFNGSILGDSFSPSAGNGTTSWTYTEHAYRDGVGAAEPWTQWDAALRFDTNAAGVSGGWNFGDGTAGSTQIDFRSVLAHEFGHALGFVDSYDPSTDKWGTTYGTASNPFTFAGYNGLTHWDQLLRDDAGNSPLNNGTGTPDNFNQTDNPVWFVGANAVAYFGGSVPIYAPTTYSGGSSLSHLDETGVPNALMSPFVNTGPAARGPTRLELEMMKDMGWSILTTKTWTRGAATLAWGDTANWGPTGLPDDTWDVVFTSAGLSPGETVDLGGSRTVNALVLDGTVDFTLGGAGAALTLAHGLLDRTAASAGEQTIAAPITLGHDAVWDIAGEGRLSVTGGVQGAYDLEKRGTGVLELDGTSTFAGTTTVEEGALLVNGVLSAGGAAVTVNTGATLGGTGTIFRNVILLGGILSPGDSGIGALALGDLFVLDGSSLAAPLTDPNLLGQSSDGGLGEPSPEPTTALLAFSGGAPHPEPATLGLLGLGLAGLGLWRRRRR